MLQRPIKTIYYSSQFLRSYKKINHSQKILAKQKEIILRKNVFDTILKTHKLTGKLSEYWSFSLTYSDRVIFKFIDNETILFIDIGDHSIYK